MTQEYFTIELPERKRGKHLRPEERGAIQYMKQLGLSNRAIAKQLNCSPSTIGYELKRGTPKYSGRGRKPKYSAKRGTAVYKRNRKNAHRKSIRGQCSKFLHWLVEQLRTEKWSFDECVGRARRNKQFEEETIPCTKTLYNWLWRSQLDLTPFDVPEALSRRPRGKSRIAKRQNGKSIDERPKEVDQRNTFGHWEFDTVVGKKQGNEAAVLSAVERLSGLYLAIRIDSKTTKGVAGAMELLKEEFGEHFSQVFKTITTDNGSEFSDFAKYEAWGTEVYFAHPYTSSERPVNERSNRLLRKFLPKGKSINDYSQEDILMMADTLNSTPRKRLDYRTPEEVFEEHLDHIYRLK